MISFSSNLDELKTLSIFIGYGIGTDVFEFSRQSAVNGVVIDSHSVLCLLVMHSHNE